MTRHALRIGAAGLTLCAALAGLSACTAEAGDLGYADRGVPLGSYRLVAFDSCDAALTGLRSALSASALTYGGYGGGPVYDMQKGADGREAAPPGAPAVGESSAGQGQHSGTNTHEAGVDEPDQVKTDGRRIVTVAGGVLRVIDAASRTVTGSVDLSAGADDVRYVAANLLLAGDRALVLVDGGYFYRGGPMIMEDSPPIPGGKSDRAVDQANPGTAGEVTAEPGEPDRKPVAQPISGPRLILVDISGPPRVLSQLRIDGGLVDARQVGSIARVVVRSSPRITFPYLGNASEARRTQTNRDIIAQAGLDAWLPRIEVSTGAAMHRQQIGCDAISRPATYTGSSLLTVLSLDLAAGNLENGQPTTLVADGETVYSNGPSLYVASDQRWRTVKSDGTPGEAETELYQFDTSAPGRPIFVAGGTVKGYLINQYAMSDWNGNLRVATTTGESWSEPGKAVTSQSGVHAFAKRDDKLTEIGSVSGLGKGERIYAVRFIGPTAYVVTFRQTDPLNTVDLSDRATRPSGAS